MELYIFNPDADLALAHGGENYIAPASARRMAADLAILPAWYACEGDAVLAPSAYNADFLQRMHDVLGLDIKLATYPELSDYAAAVPVPWGWNLALRRQLVRGGFPLENLPSADTLHAYRRWASREQVAGCLSAFKDIPFCRGESWNLKDLSACRAFVECQRHTLLKAPWSGSGKGLCWCASGFTRSVSGWCARVLREQGCVVASPVYDKVADFAMEFWKDEKKQAVFIGYSCFRTNERGGYWGNILLSDSRIEDDMGRYIPVEVLHRVRETTEDVLTHRFPGYAGYLGVDMMVCRSEEGFWLHPCVEVNLRMNMGILAVNLYRRWLAPDTLGYFKIEYHASPESLRARHHEDEVTFPMILHEGRMVSGYLPLVPVTPYSCYRAFIKVVPDTGHFHSHTDLWP